MINKTIKKGVTLVEIITATLILAGTMIPIANLMGYGAKATMKDARRIAAIQILDKTMRQLLAEDFKVFKENSLTNADTPTTWDVPICDGRIKLGEVYSNPTPTNPQNGFKYNVTLTTKFVPVTFSYKPIKVHDEGFNEAKPMPSNFEDTNDSISSDKDIVELTLTVSYEEHNKSKTPIALPANSYRANFLRSSR